MSNTKIAKEKILNSADTLFGKLGYDAATTREIAEMSGVNKALIYYYFKSKRNILDTIIENFLDEGIDAIFMIENALIKDGSKSREEILTSLGEFFSYLESKKDILIIMMVESLIQGGPNPLLQIVEKYSDSKVDEIKKSMEEKGMVFIQDKLAWLISEIFTGLLPSILFVILNEELSSHIKADRKVLLEKFIEALENTHFKTHMQ